MKYIKTISTPITTYATKPMTTKLKVWKGVIHEIEVEIPPGHAGLTKLQIFVGGHIIFPTNEDDYITGNGSVVKGRFFIELGKGTNVIDIKTWNTDETISHKHIVRIGVLPKGILMPEIMLSQIMESLTRLFV